MIRFAVAEWLMHSPATLEVTSSRPTFGGISEICFPSRCGLSSTQGCLVVCVDLHGFTIPVVSAVMTIVKTYLVIKMDCYNKKQTKQYTHIHTHTAHTIFGSYSTWLGDHALMPSAPPLYRQFMARFILWHSVVI